MNHNGSIREFCLIDAAGVFRIRLGNDYLIELYMTVDIRNRRIQIAFLFSNNNTEIINDHEHIKRNINVILY